MEYDQRQQAYRIASRGMTSAEVDWQVLNRALSNAPLNQRIPPWVNDQFGIPADRQAMMNAATPWLIEEERKVYRESADAAGGDAAYARSLDARIAQAKARVTPAP